MSTSPGRGRPRTAPRKIITWAAAVMALSGVICLTGALLLRPIANHSSSDSSPSSVAVILLAALAALAGLISVALFAGLALGSILARLWHRSGRAGGPGREAPGRGWNHRWPRSR